ncbi:MAG: ATP-binding cassette domain-containing protein [Blastochloris sp.]|nr:ATP-binding cassette domain-containing protein [Blastochloris sp.]
MAIDIHNVTLTYRRKQILHNLSLQVPVGTVVGLVGPNGAGKTSLFRLLGGLISSFRGAVQVLGYEVPKQVDALRRRLGVVTEPDGLYEDMRVIDVLNHTARLYLPDDQQRQRARIEAVLRYLDVWDQRNDWCGILSTGLRRRVAIARAILHEPPLLLLDEVTNGLDILSRNAFYEWLAAHQMNAATNTVVLATHNSTEAARLCNFFIVLRDGRQCFCGRRDQLVGPNADADELERAFLRAPLDAVDDIIVLGEAGTAAEAIRLAATLQPHVVVLDVQLAGESGFDACCAIVEDTAAPKVVMLTAFDWDSYLAQAWAAGASAFVVKHVELDALVEAIRQTYRQPRWFPPTQLQRLWKWQQDVESKLHALSPREHEVLSLVLQGLPNLDIAAELVVSQSTVEKHINALLSKLQMKTCRDLIAFGLRHHLGR